MDKSQTPTKRAQTQARKRLKATNHKKKFRYTSERDGFGSPQTGPAARDVVSSVGRSQALCKQHG